MYRLIFTNRSARFLQRCFEERPPEVDRAGLKIWTRITDAIDDGLGDYQTEISAIWDQAKASRFGARGNPNLVQAAGIVEHTLLERLEDERGEETVQVALDDADFSFLTNRWTELDKWPANKGVKELVPAIDEVFVNPHHWVPEKPKEGKPAQLNIKRAGRVRNATSTPTAEPEGESTG